MAVTNISISGKVLPFILSYLKEFTIHKVGISLLLAHSMCSPCSYEQLYNLICFINNEVRILEFFQRAICDNSIVIVSVHHSMGVPSIRVYRSIVTIILTVTCLSQRGALVCITKPKICHGKTEVSEKIRANTSILHVVSSVTSIGNVGSNTSTSYMRMLDKGSERYSEYPRSTDPLHYTFVVYK